MRARVPRMKAAAKREQRNAVERRAHRYTALFIDRPAEWTKEAYFTPLRYELACETLGGGK